MWNEETMGIMKKYSYADYLKWSDAERWEIIDGVPYDMSPAPGTNHQTISMYLSAKIWNFLKGKPCRVFAAPFDVRLPGKEKDNEKIFTVVQPDLVVLCAAGNNKKSLSERIDEKGCIGAPDVVIEILSGSTAYKNESDKLRLYEKHGVKEYWIINPSACYVMIYRLENEFYRKPEYLLKTDILQSRVVNGLEIDIGELFAEVE